ncbi:MAG TPA: serine/threonine protein kinase, partial [Allocoleopsis sp.]
MKTLFKQTNPDRPLGGRYRIISELGAGGFGQTFLAQDLHLPDHPQCVVKQLKPQVSDAASFETARRLFDIEARVLYRLGDHDQIPRL